MLTMLNSFKIKDYVQGSYEITESPVGLKAEDLFELGVRINPKRSFLFVNKLLGKHLEVHPQVPRLTGMLLAHQYAMSKGYFSPFTSEKLVSLIRHPEQYSKEDYRLLQTIPWKLPKKVLFIGFCETATGLGYATFANFSNTAYLHTTREELSRYLKSRFDFEEEHSHATEHYAFAKDSSLFDVNEIILVDDEVTTGKTALNLIRALSNEYNVRNFTVLSLLDWRNEDHKIAALIQAKDLALNISFNSLASGDFQITQESPITQYDYPSLSCVENNDIRTKTRVYYSSQLEPEHFDDKTYANYTGRFGIHSKVIPLAEFFAVHLAEELEKYRVTKGKTMVIGHGEFIYFPSRIASYMTNDITFKSSTRSPILPLNEKLYPIQDVARFKTESQDTYFVYNLKRDGVKEVFYVFETPLSEQDLKNIQRAFSKQGVEVVHFIKCI